MAWKTHRVTKVLPLKTLLGWKRILRFLKNSITIPLVGGYGPISGEGDPPQGSLYITETLLLRSEDGAEEASRVRRCGGRRKPQEHVSGIPQSPRPQEWDHERYGTFPSPPPPT